MNLLNDERKDDFEFINETSSEGQNEKIKLIFKPSEANPAEAHDAFLQFQILCPTYEGENGVML